MKGFWIRFKGGEKKEELQDTEAKRWISKKGRIYY